MGEVVKFRRQRQETCKGVARELLTEATRHVRKPSAVCIIAINADTGDYALRMTNDQSIKPVDVYGRSIALLSAAQRDLLEMNNG